MHDFYAANKILKLVLNFGQKNNLRAVSKIVIDLGQIEEHGEEIKAENFKFNFKLLAKNTIAKNALVIINRIPGNKIILREIEGKINN